MDGASTFSSPISGTEPGGFNARIDASLAKLAPAEQRMARFFADQKQFVLLRSATEIAQAAGTSDATVVRTARSLGFEGLSDLRELLLADLTGVASPDGRLARTLDAAGDDAASMLTHVVGIHEGVLSIFKRPDFIAAFGQSVEILAGASRRHVFGIGPSGAMAEYATLQFNRIGLPTTALSVSGIALADRLLWLRDGDAVLMMAYAPLYREVEIVLEQAARVGAPVVLISDTLGPFVSDRVSEMLPIPRGKADHLAMHGGTVVLIDALIIALAAQNREAALDTLDAFSTLRSGIDRAWSKRGQRKK